MTNLNKTINQILDNVIKDIEDIFELALKNAEPNKKTGNNTLVNSDLAKESKVTRKNNLFQLRYNDYLDYIEQGRKPKTKKVPIKDLIQWAKEKGIPSDNNTIYAIQQSIYNVGIEPRNVKSNFEKYLDEYWINDLSDRLFEELTKNLLN